MASTKGGLIKNQNTSVQQAQQPMGMAGLLNDTSVRKRFEDMLGKKSAGFLSSLLSLSKTSNLAKTDPRTILAAAATAAALDLPINPSLGKAWIVPYGSSAQFQLGYKGLIELAQRSGVLKFITMTPVYKGEIKNWNRFTETYETGEKESEEIVGYFARFELVNGFAKAEYWERDKVLAHAKRFSKSFGSGPWQTDFDSMACKTVLKHILSTYCPMSLEMATALESDGQVKSFNEDGDIETVEAFSFDVENSTEVTEEATNNE